MKLLALDGNSLAYRAFFALPDTMATVDGEVTNAVFGFCSMFATLVKDHDPDGIIVVFDRKEKTFRHEAAPEYKAQREKQPDTLYSQMDVIKRLLASAGVLTLDAAGFEGDDIIATIAANIGADDELLIVTGDRDSYQLVRDPQVRVVYNLRGVTEYAIYDEAGIKTRTGVTPAQYADYAALRGDPSDNLEGVPGVGEKTAAKLINAYGTLEAVFDHADEQTPKLRESLHASRERVLRNARLMRLATDVPVELDRARFAPAPMWPQCRRSLRASSSRRSPDAGSRSLRSLQRHSRQRHGRQLRSQQRRSHQPRSRQRLPPTTCCARTSHTRRRQPMPSPHCGTMPELPSRSPPRGRANPVAVRSSDS